MAKKSQPQQGGQLNSTALPNGGLQLGNGGGALDTSTLPKPTLPQWNGWQNINRKPSGKP
jgi:hypothetical protein